MVFFHGIMTIFVQFTLKRAGAVCHSGLGVWHCPVKHVKRGSVNLQGCLGCDSTAQLRELFMG